MARRSSIAAYASATSLRGRVGSKTLPGSMRGTPTQPTMPPGRADFSACTTDSSVPTHSSHRVGADAVGEVLDGLQPGVAALGDDVGGTELSGNRLSVGVTAHGDDPLRADLRGGKDAAEADRPVTHHDHGAARGDLGAERGVPARAHDVRQREQAGHQVVGRLLRGGEQGSVRVLDPDALGLAAVVTGVGCGTSWMPR